MMTRTDRVQVARAIISKETLVWMLESHYDLAQLLSCRLRFSGDNDTYLVQSGAGYYMLRVYRGDRYWNQGKENYLFELDWLAFLYSRGLSVSCAIPRRDGALLGEIDAPEGTRYWALFSFAEGCVVYPMDQKQSYLFGQKVAEIHLVSNDFTPRYQRFRYDLEFLLGQPLTKLSELLSHSHREDLAFLEDLANKLKTSLLALNISGDGYGMIGGDFHGGNNHFTAHNELTFFDFDICGYGWRVYDLAVFIHNSRLNGSPAQMREAVLEGYQSVRSLSPEEQQALPLFVMARRVWRMGVRASEVDVAGDLWLVNGYWERAIAALRAWYEEVDFDAIHQVH